MLAPLPAPSQPRENVRRARTALRALRAGGYLDGNDVETAITDLLSDLRHLCDRRSLAFLECDGRADRHYLHEA
jgi:hypothetical protein